MRSNSLVEGKRSIQELLAWGTQALKPLGKAEARVTAERLLEELTGFDRFHLYLNSGRSLSDAVIKQFLSWISQRKKRVPVAYLTGKAYFWREVLSVSPGCLIPRPETETLIEKFVERSGLKPQDKFNFIDIGSGSGAIGIALLRHYPKAHGDFADISPRALVQTRKNLKKYGLLRRSKIVLSDLFSAFKQKKWCAVISNPPYLSKADLRKAQPEILKEPRQALDGGLSGMNFYRQIIAEAPARIEKDGWLVLEAGKGQAEKIKKLIQKTKAFNSIEIFKDLNRIQRAVMAQKN